MPDTSQPWTIEQVARFDHQATGVTFSEHGRIFVNFPRWTEDSAVSVAELNKDGTLRPYPDGRWNAWRNARKDELAPEEHWGCVQSVVADGRGSLWVLAPAVPAQAHLVAGGTNKMLLSAVGEDAVKLRDLDQGPGAEARILVHDARLRWPDTFTQGRTARST